MGCYLTLFLTASPPLSEPVIITPEAKPATAPVATVPQNAPIAPVKIGPKPIVMTAETTIEAISAICFIFIYLGSGINLQLSSI